MRIFFLLYISSLLLLARDNPFFPADPNEQQIVSSNKAETLKPYSTQSISLPNSARAIKAVIIRYQNLDGSIAQETLELNNQIDWHKPLIVSQEKSVQKAPVKKRERARSVGTKFISFTADGKNLKIGTKDRLIRHFMLTSPHRIVVDFSRDTSFRPKEFMLKRQPYTKIRMGNHDKYYRVVIELDGQYRYKLQTNAQEHTLVCY